MKIAVIGTGISGNLVARLLADDHDVAVYEAGAHIGGHAQTVEFEAFGGTWHADTGFMVFNDRTYPNFLRLLEMLGVPSQPSDMSFSVRCGRTGLEYQGSSLNGLFAQRSNFISPRFWFMLRDIVRFNEVASKAIENGDLEGAITVGDFLDRHRLGNDFRDRYLVPMVAAIWSARPLTVREFPAKFLLGFMRNHGLLQIRDRPEWKTVPGGSRVYVQRLVAPLLDRIRLNCAVQSVTRQADHVKIRTEDGDEKRFDRVVLAVHADQALRLLTDATSTEREVLGAFPYQTNEAVLHTDVGVLPRRRRAWASWNYYVSDESGEPATITYDLSRLQRLATPRPVLLTLNRTAGVDSRQVLRRLIYEHPAYSQASIAAQTRFHEINELRRTYFCGAYWGYGFHEDGVNSALAVAAYFGKSLETCRVVSMKDRSRTAVLSQ